jgi:small subunit ribosomal protein S4
MVKVLKKQYETPNEAWNQERMDKEAELTDQYGLGNKKEMYKAYSELRGFRRQARKLIAEDDEEQKQDILRKANKLGLVKSDARLEDLLTLSVEDILNRRLQTAVSRRGLADTPKEARQLVNHGHIKIDGEVVNVPSYRLTKEEEKNVELDMPEPPQEEPEEAEEDEEDVSENSEEDEEEEEE